MSCICFYFNIILWLIALLTASYRRLLISYTLVVSLSSIIALLLFGVLKVVAWPNTLHPSPIREFLLAGAGWIVAFALRRPILYLFTLFDSYVNGFTVLLSTFFQVISEETIRLAILILIQLHLQRPEVQHLLSQSGLSDPPNGDNDGDWAPLPDVWDGAFTQVWWIALGWATIDVAVGIVQGYEQLSLYRDVLARERSHAHSPSPVRHKRSRSKRPTNENEEPLASQQTAAVVAADGAEQLEAQPASARVLNSSVIYSVTPARMHSTEQLITLNGSEAVIVATPRDLEAELSHLMTRKQRAELEEVYGSPLPRIPIFLIALQRLDSILLSLGLTLLISSAYLRALYLPAIPTDTDPTFLGAPRRYERDWEVDWTRVKDTTLPVFALVVIVHFILSTLWIEALPRIGVHTVSYVGLLFSLAAFFAGLGYWGALV